MISKDPSHLSCNCKSLIGIGWVSFQTTYYLNKNHDNFHMTVAWQEVLLSERALNECVLLRIVSSLTISLASFGGIGSLSEIVIRGGRRKEGARGEGRHKKAIETSIVKFVARFRCSPFPTGVTLYISSSDINNISHHNESLMTGRQHRGCHGSSSASWLVSETLLPLPLGVPIGYIW